MMLPALQELRVLYCGWGERWEFGRLAQAGDALLFEYSQTALQRGWQFSPLHLPLRSGAFGPFPACPFGLPGLLADALPDGWGLLLMDRVLRRQQSGRLFNPPSALQRLAMLGDFAMGAFCFEPAQTLAAQEQTDLTELAQTAARILHGGEVADGDLLNMLRLGGSPQGARPKVLLDYAAQAQAAPQPWLFKFPAAHEDGEVCVLEHAYAQLARACGLPMPDTVCLPLAEGLYAFGVARFDRVRGQRVPMHSLAGLLHMQPGRAVCGYAEFLRATRMLTRDVREVRQAWLRALFNLLFHNRDDHARNFAFCMQADGHWRLAPCFDLTWSEGPGGEHQMDFMGEARQPGRAHLLALAQQEGLDVKWAQQEIAAFCQVALDASAFIPPQGVRSATRNTLLLQLQTQAQALLSA